MYFMPLHGIKPTGSRLLRAVVSYKVARDWWFAGGARGEVRDPVRSGYV